MNARMCSLLSAPLLAAALFLAPAAAADPIPGADVAIPGADVAIPGADVAIPGADVAIAKAESALGSDMFGPYGCEAFVAYAYGVSQAQYGWDGAAETMYQTLLREGQLHTDMNAPRGALVFSKSPYGAHIDIARGDGTYISGGVQGLKRGYGDGHNIQILPSPHVGNGWVYRGWSLGYPD